MSKSMRAFCLLATVGLIAGSIWLYVHGMKSRSFCAACFAYLPPCFALLGEVLVPVSRVTPKRAYKGESRAELIRRDLEDLQKAYPNSKWPARHEAVVGGLLLGFLAWIVVLALMFY